MVNKKRDFKIIEVTDYADSCDFCEYQDETTRRYCFFWRLGIKNMDMKTCRFWKEKEDLKYAKPFPED